MGRQPVELNYDVIDTALFFGATMNQLIYLIEKKDKKYDRKTIERSIKKLKKMTFTVYRNHHQDGLKFKLVQKAVSLALGGNVVMLIFCLKNLCGWTDKVIDQNVEVNNVLLQNVDSKELLELTLNARKQKQLEETKS